MSDVWPQLLLVGILVLVNAAFAGTELALVSLRESQLQRLEERSADRRRPGPARPSAEPVPRHHPDRHHARRIPRLGGGRRVARRTTRRRRSRFLGGAAEPVSVIVVTLILAYFTLVFGELAPKRIAMQRAEKWGMVMARPLDLLSTLTKPIVWLLSMSTDIAVRLLGGDPTRQREEVTGDELRDMVAIHDTFPPEQRQIIDGAFEIAERTLDEVMVPRNDVVVIDAAAHLPRGARRAPGRPDTPARRSPRSATSTGRSGWCASAALLDRRRRPRHRRDARTSRAFPDAARVLTALREFQTHRTQMAIVDRRARPAARHRHRRGPRRGTRRRDLRRDRPRPRHRGAARPTASIVVPGAFPVHDLVDLDVELPEGDYTTISGLVLDQLGRFPEIGETIESTTGRSRPWRSNVTGSSGCGCDADVEPIDESAAG